MLAGNAKNGMRSLNDLLRYRSEVCPAHNENTTGHWMHAITEANNIRLSETVGRGGGVGVGGTSQVQGDMSSSSDKNIHRRKRVVNHFIHLQIREASLCCSLPRIARSGRQTVSQLPSPPEISQEDLKHTTKEINDLVWLISLAQSGNSQ